MNHEDLQNTSGEKSIPLFSVIIWLCLCHTTLGIVKKWKLRKLDSYTSVLNRYHETRNAKINHNSFIIRSRFQTVYNVFGNGQKIFGMQVWKFFNHFFLLWISSCRFTCCSADSLCKSILNEYLQEKRNCCWRTIISKDDVYYVSCSFWLCCV